MVSSLVLAASVPELLGSSWPQLATVLIATVAIYGTVILAGRIMGLRSFAKMSAFDFAATIAVGSIAASTAILDTVSLAAGAVALGTLYLLQAVVARLRVGSRSVQQRVDNSPLVLMAGSEVLHDHLRLGQVTVDDLRAKLREAGVRDRSEVRVVVLETTGDISVVAGPDPVETWLLEGVRGAEGLGTRVHGEE